MFDKMQAAAADVQSRHTYVQRTKQPSGSSNLVESASTVFYMVLFA